MTRIQAGPAVLAVALALSVVGCTAAAATAAPSITPAPSVAAPTSRPTAPATPTPTASPTPAPTLTPSPADTATAARAVAIVKAMGGTVPSAGAIARSPNPLGTPGTFFTIGDWSVAWDSAGQLNYVADVPSGIVPPPGAPVTQSQARVRVADYIAKLGVALAAPDGLTQNGEKSWLAQWHAKVGGVPSPADTTTMTLGSDGVFVSFRHVVTAATAS
jgi:hypothetical protein